MRAVVLDRWGGDLSVETVPVPDPGPGEVRVDVRACGVTRTVENAIGGGLADDPGLTPRIPGHEFAGVVEAVGDGVTGVEVGDRVLAYFYLTCGDCDACRRGDTAQCLDFGGWYGVNCEGAYAERAVLPAENALPLPDGASFREGAVAADGVATPIHVCERADVTDDDAVAVLGAAGRIGVHVAQVAALRGATVLAVDVGEERLAHVESVVPGAIGVDASEGDPTDRLAAAAPYGDGPTVVVDTVGKTQPLRAAWESLAMGGRLVTLTTHHDRSLDVPLKEYVVTEASLLGSRYATRDEVVRAARTVADGRVEAVTTGTTDLPGIPEVHRRIREGETHGMTVLDP
ncbi:NADPH:quinone oxidoreductase [Halobacteriales archaeon QS_8_69_26]|nr:MAG: NADPH:quinone oxidoreductase [Halobacteriales archaeon QS_8_69_26]